MHRFDMNNDLIPVFIPLRRLSKINNNILDDLIIPENSILQKSTIDKCPKRLFEKLAKKGKCIFLLDGLDEVTDEETHKLVATKINNFTANFPTNRYIVTCRIAGWDSQLNGFSVLQVDDLSNSQIEEFIYGWNRAIVSSIQKDKFWAESNERSPTEAHWEKYYFENVEPAIKKIASKLSSAILQNERLLDISRTPMLLSLINLVHLKKFSLPKGRVELYDQCINLLIDHWDRSRDILTSIDVDSEEKERILQNLAFEFHQQGISEDRREKIENLIQKDMSKPVNKTKLLEEIEKRSGILTERSINILGFSHLTLQEYLAARHIYYSASENYTLLLQGVEKQEWREVILLYAGLLGDATQLVQDILNVSSDYPKFAKQTLNSKDIKLLLLAGHCISGCKSCAAWLETAIIDELITRLRKESPAENHGIVEVLTQIATDYNDEPRTPREKLSKLLISELQNKL